MNVDNNDIATTMKLEQWYQKNYFHETINYKLLIIGDELKFYKDISLFYLNAAVKLNALNQLQKYMSKLKQKDESVRNWKIYLKQVINSLFKPKVNSKVRPNDIIGQRF